MTTFKQRPAIPTTPLEAEDTALARLMSNGFATRHLSRRDLIKLTGLAAAGAVGATILRGLPTGVPAARVSAAGTQNIALAATDGFTLARGSVAGPTPGTPYLPDPLAPAPLTMWGFGFRNVTGLSPTQVQAQRGKFQASAPQLWVEQYVPALENDVKINLTNLGLSVRPDLTDSHTIHWHGFRNALPLFDGVPEMSVAVPLGRNFTYLYRPHDPGTYMYHCHFEDTEHVSMGMTGIIFVRPAQNAGNGGSIPAGKYVYNDGVAPSHERSTAYDREWGMFLSEGWALEHYEGAHILEHDWSDYDPDLWFLNGRSWPDTIIGPGGGNDPTSGDLIAPAGHDELQYNPISSLVHANGGDRVLFRFVNLGFQQHAMTIDGLTMRIVGKDATYLNGRDGTDLSYLTNTVYIGPGESVDAIIDMPSVASPKTFLLYNRNLAYLHNPGEDGAGGQMTEIHVFPSGVGPQTAPNTNPA
jgi:FtsP/CotA-like multicopper oxidase with cupredoxin domain